jgi:hypothetical protein
MPMALMLGMSIVSGGAPIYTFTNSEAGALVARFTVQPTNARKALIDNLVGSLKTAGVWTKLDALHVLAAHDAQAARQNWVADAYNLTAVAAPTFTTDRGYQGDGSSSYLDTGFNPTTAVTPQFVQNSGHLSVWSRTSGAAAPVDMGNGNSIILTRQTTTDNFARRVNASSSDGTVVADGSGHFLVSRPNSTSSTGYRNAATQGSGSVASAAPDNAAFRVLGRSTTVSFSSRQIAMSSIGASLTSGEVTGFYNALNTYMQAVGAA